MSLSTAAKVAGATGIIGGATMLTIGAINANTANNSQGSGTDPDQIDALEQQLSDYGANVDMSQAREDYDAAATHVDRWQGAGLTTAIAGGVGVASGIAGLLATGPAGAALRGIALGAGLVAGGAALFGLNSYLRVGEHNDRARHEAERELESAVAQVQARQAPTVASVGPATAVDTTIDAGPELTVVSPQVHDAVATADIDWFETNAAEVRPVDTYARDNAWADQQNARIAPDLNIEMRRATAGLTGIAMADTGPVDWQGFARQLDVNGDQLLDTDERADARLGAYVAVYANAAQAVGEATDPEAPYRAGFLAAALDGTHGEDLATAARMFVMSAGVDLRGDVDSSYLDELQAWAMDVHDRIAV